MYAVKYNKLSVTVYAVKYNKLSVTVYAVKYNKLSVTVYAVKYNKLNIRHHIIICLHDSVIMNIIENMEHILQITIPNSNIIYIMTLSWT